MSNKDQQFSGFAKAVVDKIYGLDKTAFPRILSPEEAQIVLARAAYDLVAHTLDKVERINLDRLDIAENVECIPDLPVLPQEASE